MFICFNRVSVVSLELKALPESTLLPFSPFPPSTVSQNPSYHFQGMTHKKEWDAFTRQLKTGSQIPGAVSEYAVSQNGKKELFGMWLDAKQDWDECNLILKRKLENSSTAERGWCAIQGRELKLRYTEAKWNSLRDSRKAAGLWYEDEDFPGG